MTYPTSSARPGLHGVALCLAGMVFRGELIVKGESFDDGLPVARDVGQVKREIVVGETPRQRFDSSQQEVAAGVAIVLLGHRHADGRWKAHGSGHYHAKVRTHRFAQSIQCRTNMSVDASDRLGDGLQAVDVRLDSGGKALPVILAKPCAKLAQRANLADNRALIALA